MQFFRLHTFVMYQWSISNCMVCLFQGTDVFWVLKQGPHSYYDFISYDAACLIWLGIWTSQQMWSARVITRVLTYRIEVTPLDGNRSHTHTPPIILTAPLRNRGHWVSKPQPWSCRTFHFRVLLTTDIIKWIMFQPIRFKLNHASTTGRPPIDREFSLWVGDLTPDVDDYTLYRTFASRYQSIRTAKGEYFR